MGIELIGFDIQLNNPVLEDSVDLNSSETSVQDTIDVHKMCEETRQQAYKKIAVYRKMYDDLEAYFSNEKKLAEEAERNMKELQEHKNDLAYYQQQAIDTVKDIAYMECIKTLTYGNV